VIGDTASAHATPDNDNPRLLWKISHDLLGLLELILESKVFAEHPVGQTLGLL
jgi:hypothetical protein